jgi:hypothetical protein
MPSSNIFSVVDDNGSVMCKHVNMHNSVKNESLLIVLHDLFENVHNPLSSGLFHYIPSTEFVFFDVLALSFNSDKDFYESTIQDKVAVLDKTIESYSSEYKSISVLCVGVSSIVALMAKSSVDKTIFINPIFNFNLERFYKTTPHKTTKLGVTTKYEGVDVDVFVKNNLTFVRKSYVREKDLIYAKQEYVITNLMKKSVNSLIIFKEQEDNFAKIGPFELTFVGDLQNFVNPFVNAKFFNKVFSFIKGSSINSSSPQAVVSKPIRKPALQPSYKPKSKPTANA